MSLHALANHLQQAGRGDDKVLIHMTPKEVKGLQSLAMAHGGSLTINPQTGLPEAGFLSRLLPTLIGAGLTIASGGALSPLMAAGITGAGYGIAKGSLKEGLMAGLGAYGGAGLASGLNAAGAAAAPSANIGANANAVVNSGTAAAEAAKGSSYTGLGSNVGASGTLQASNLSQPIIQNYPSAVMPSAKEVMSRGFATVPDATKVALQPPIQAAAPEVITQTVPNVTPSYFDNVKAGFGEATGSFKGLQNVWDKTPTGTGYGLAATGIGIMQDSQNKGIGNVKASDSYLRPYDYSVAQNEEAYAPNTSTSERMYFNQPRFTARPIQKIAKEGGLLKLAVGGQPEREAAYQSVSMNDSYPMAQLKTPMYSDPSMQRPMARDVVNPSGDVGVDEFTGQPRMAGGGLSTLGGYSDGGRLLKGPGDGVSDSIPASIGNRQPARLADGEFVVPARIVSEIGNGSTEAGARKLYAMMERVQRARRKTVGKNQVAKNTKAERLLPA
jgi:hypothetical protein